MNTTTVIPFILMVGLMWLARTLLLRVELPAGKPAAAPAKPIASRNAARRTVAAPLEWGGKMPSTLLLGLDAQHDRIRDRYIAARFPGVLRGSSELLDAEYVIKAARHYFEEGRLDDAAELFALAIEQSPNALPLRLAQIEITFLARDAVLYVSLARDLRALRRELPQWEDVARLGRALVPGEPLFGAEPGDSGDGHYGPWPEMPNWIQASWDLTPEVLAAEFHRALNANLRESNTPSLRRVA